MGLLQGKAILVSGASGGLGKGVLSVLRAHGARVAGVARNWDAGQVDSESFLAIQADLSVPEQVSQAVLSTQQKFGRIDAAVHLMGGFAMDGPLHESKVETFDRMISINARSAFLLFQAALAPMLQAGTGRIVAVGSRSGHEPAAGMAAYAASKAALHMLVRSLALELKGTGVTANAILPSIIDTEINRKAMPGADFHKWVSPSSIGEVIAWICSDASQDLNGALVPVYGQA